MVEEKTVFMISPEEAIKKILSDEGFKAGTVINGDLVLDHIPAEKPELLKLEEITINGDLRLLSAEFHNSLIIVKCRIKGDFVIRGVIFHFGRIQCVETIIGGGLTIFEFKGELMLERSIIQQYVSQSNM